MTVEVNKAKAKLDAVQNELKQTSALNKVRFYKLRKDIY